MAKLDNEAKQRILKSLNQNSKATPFTGVAQTAPTSISDEQGTDSIKTTPNNEDFSNGFQMAFGKTMGTVDRGMTNVYTGIASFFEGIIDWGANVVSSFTDFIGADKATEEINKFIENRWSDDVGEFLGYTANPLARLHSAIAGVDDVRDYAWELENKKANEIVTGIEQSVGQMLPSIALGQVASGLGASAKAAGNLSTIGMSLSAAGGGSEKALSEGASSLEALGYGTATGVIEYGTEQLSGWIGKGLNKITGKSIFSEGALPFMTKNMESKLSASALGNIALQFGSEGLEEVVSDLFEPLTEAIYTKKIGQLDAGELATDFIVGGVTGSIFGSISTIADRTSKNKAQKVINQANTEIKRFDRIEDQYKVGEVSQEVYNQEKQNFKKTMKDLATEFYDIQGVQEAVTDPNNVNRLMPTQYEVDYVNGYYQTNQWTQGIQNQNVNPNFTSENPNKAEMDYNMEYDHDNIAENHKKPQVAFMVNTDKNVETSHFNKDQYDEAVAYRDSYLEKNSVENEKKPEIAKDKNERKVKEYTTPISLERAIKNDTDNFLKKSAYTYIDNSDTSIKHKIKIEYTPNLDVNGKKRAGRFKRIANTDVRSLNKSTFQDISDYVYDHARIVVDNQAYTLEQLFETEKDFLVAFSNAQSKVNKLTSVSEFYQKQLAKVVSQLNTFREMVKFQESIRKSTQKMIQNMRKANKGLHTANLYLSDKVAAFEKLMEKIGDAKVYGRKTREYLRQLNDLYVKQESLQTSETDIVQEDLTPFGAHFIEPLKARIEELANGEGVLTGSELVELKKILQAFNYQLNKVANDRYVKMDGEQTGSISKDVDLYETTLSKTPARSNNSLLSAVRSKYFDNIIDPKSYFEAVDHYGLYGKGFFTQMIQDLRKRHNVELKNKLEFDQLHADFEKAHKNYFNDLRRERIEMNFQNTNGNPVNLTKGQLIGLYCTLKVESGFEHIRKSGFHYEQKSGIWAKISHTEFNADTLMSDIESHFSEVDKAYIDLVEQIMQKAKKLKSKTDMDLYGISNVEEGWYYPTKVANANFSVKVGDATATFRDIRNVANQSWNKSKNRKIFGSLMVSSVQDVLSNYERGVSRYNAYATEIDYINRVLNSVIVDETGKHRSIRYTLDKKGYQHNFMSYLNHFLSDVQGMPNPKEYSIVNQGLSHVRSATVTYTLGLNLSTMVRQTASLANAYSSPFLSVGDLTKATLSTAGINNREFNKLIKERSPFLYARFSDEEVAKANAVNEKINKAISLTMKGLTKFDKIAIAKIYRASQYSVQRRTGHAIGTETNTKMALELCEEVTRNTQPNYSSLERSAWQRPNTNELTKMLMMYMSQPMKNLSRTFEAVNENRAVRQALKNDLGNAELKTRLKQSNKQVAKTLSALTASGMIYTLMGMLMKSLMGKKDWDEWSIQEFVTGTFENTYIGMFPLIKDIYGKFVHDYDITMNSFDVINDLISSFAGVTSGISDAIQGKDVDWWNRSRKFLFSVAQVVGVPLKNMYDITYAVMKTFNPDTAYKAESLLYGTSSSTMTSDYQKYIQKGKTDQATAILKSQFEIYKTGVSPNQTVLEELNRLVSEGYTNVVPSNVGDTIVIDGETYELNANQKTKFKKYYSESTNAVNRLVVSDIYSRLTSEQQAKAIRRVYTAYYDYAKTKLMEGYLPSSKLGAVVSLNLNSTKIAEFSAIVSYASEIKATRRKTRKEQVQEFIDKQNLTKNEKYLAYVLCGYSLNETQKRSLKNFLRQNGMPIKEISDFFNEDSSEEE